jgi:hypothetical protein
MSPDMILVNESEGSGRDLSRYQYEDKRFWPGFELAVLELRVRR